MALGRTVAELEATLSAAELNEWAAYYTLEPWGQERDNWHAAMLASLLANVHRKKGTPTVQVAEFMYRDRRAAAQKKTTDFIAGMTALAKPKRGE